MHYWIFRCRDTGHCLALPEVALGSTPISDDMGELLHDEPKPADVASMYVARYGGVILGVAGRKDRV